MERLKRIAGKLLHPGRGASAGILLVGFGSLAGVFYFGAAEHPLACMSYALSFYALVIAVVNIIPLAARCKRLYQKGKAAGVFSMGRSLMLSMTINLAYAGYNLASGACYHSVWLISNGVYYLVLSLIRMLLASYERKQLTLADPKDRLIMGWKVFSLCGMLMFLLNIAMAGMVAQMIWGGQGSTYPEIVVYAVATYTFYRLTAAIIGVAKSGYGGEPIHGAARNISLAAAMMSLYALQVTMLDVFGGGKDILFNGISGSAVCVLGILGALGMTLHGSRRKRELEQERDQKR